jgi:hypothetical protein
LAADGRDEATYLRDHFSRIEVEGDEDIPAPATAIPNVGALEELGIKMDDVKTAKVTTETGASLTPAEAKRVFAAVEHYVGFRIDRASFIVNFIDWGIRNSFTEELTDAGGFQITSHATVSHVENYYKISSLHSAVNEFFSTAATGRSFTFRRLGRFLGRSIPSLVENNDQLKKFYTEGSPMSNRLGVPPQDFLAVCSIFEHIKPYHKWSPGEKRAWEAHNRSVKKVANVSNAEFLPTDLRPSPSQAATLVDEGRDDFSRRHTQDYGMGRDMFEQMLKRASTVRNDRAGLGSNAE